MAAPEEGINAFAVPASLALHTLQSVPILGRALPVLVFGLIYLVEDIYKMTRTLRNMLSHWQEKRIRRNPNPDLILEDGLEVTVEELPFGFGAYTSIFRGHRKGKGKCSEVVALKVWRPTGSPDSQDYTRFYNALEVRLLAWKNLHHPNIDPILGVTEGMGYIPALITNYYPLGNVNEYLAKHPSSNKLEILLGLSSALCYLHNQEPPFPHGDLRGSNILMTPSGEPILTDVGIANIPLPPDWTIPTSESTRWMAPEIMSPDCENQITRSNLEDYPSLLASCSGDVYSFGMTMLEIYTARVPYAHRRFYGPVVFEVVNGIRPPRPIVSELSCSDELWDVVTSCWEHDPKRRPNIHTVDSWLRVIMMSGMGLGKLQE